MASVADVQTSLNGNFKYMYADQIQKLKPEDIHFLDDLPFTEAQKIGRLYLQPVLLTLSHGITFAPSSAVPQLNSSVTSQMLEAQVDGFQSILRDQISYEAASRAASSRAAFKDATQLIVENMRVSHMMKLEIQELYGQVGLCTVASTSLNVITVPPATWGPGIWTGAEGMPISIYSAAGVYRGDCTITVISLELKQLTVDALPAGTVATDVIYFKGAFGNEPAGIHKILANTGLLFNIDASKWNLWAAYAFNCSGGALTFNKIIQGCAKARPKGMRGAIKLYVNPSAFADLVNEIEAARGFSATNQWSPNQIERGTQNLVYHGVNGTVEIQVHDIVWGGNAYGLIMDGSWKRIGSSEVTFRLPGRPQDEFFMELENTAAYELRSFADFAPFCCRPGANILFTNINNTTL